ncbi:hypothetical protein ANO11243_033490 [Dothideomycetidae sp. 11243]|nr:hypothetical protein ANO11243_033490 [fungal sp. No.11243]
MAEVDISFLPDGANLHTFTLGSHPLVLSLPSEEAYHSTRNPCYFGATVGRVANRIANGTLHLNGVTYSLPRNDSTGKHTLHGGNGFSHASWSGPHPESRHGTEAVRFDLRSEDGDHGFPGAVEVRAWFIARTDGAVTSLEVEYEARWADDGPTTGTKGEKLDETVVHLANHSCFTVAPWPADGASPSLDGTRATLFTDRRQVVDAECIPSGVVAKHPDVRAGEAFTLGKDGPAFDDCFVIETGPPENVPLDTRGGDLRRLAAFSHPDTGVHLEAWSTEPAFQFYTGEYIDLDYEDPKTGKKHKFAKRAGFCVEASRFVDAPSRPEWKGMVLLKRGQVWGSRTVYKAWKE